MACVLGEKRNPHPALIQSRVRTQIARQIPPSHGFYLDHLSAQMHQLVAGERTGEDVGQVEDANAVQGGGGHGAGSASAGGLVGKISATRA